MSPEATNQRVLAILKAARNQAADAALLEALPALSPPRCGWVLQTLIERGRPAALNALLSSFSGYAQPVRAEFLSRTTALESALRLAISQATPEPRLGALAIAAESGDPRLAYLAVESLHVPCERTREAAGKLLLRLVESAGEGSAPRLDDEIGRALRSWEAHRRPEIVRAAALRAGTLQPVIEACLAPMRSAFVAALTAVLNGPAGAPLAPFTLWALSVAPLRDAAARLIARSDDTGFICALAARSWRMRSSDLQKALARVRELAWLRRSIDPLLSLRGWQARAAVRFAGALGGEPGAKVELLSRLIEAQGSFAASTALALLSRLEHEAVEPILRRQSAHRNPRIAGAAARVLRKRAARQTTVSFPWSSASSAARSTNSPEEDVYRQVHDPDPVVRSTAVTALGALRTPTAMLLLRRALHDPDFRVQANAIEVLETVEADSVERYFEEKLESPDNRVRANAIKALLRADVRRAAESLLEMLAGDDAAERLSALWVVERLHVASLMRRVEALATADPDERVRDRAGHLLARLAHDPTSPSRQLPAVTSAS